MPRLVTCTCGSCRACGHRAANRRHYAGHAERVKRKTSAAYRLSLLMQALRVEPSDAELDARALAWLEGKNLQGGVRR